MARAEHTIRGSRRDAGIIGRSAVAGWSGPTRITDTLTTFTSAMIRAELTLITIAREIVAFAKMSRYYLQKYKYALSQIFPEFIDLLKNLENTSSGFSRSSHSHWPQAHVPRPEQSTRVVLSGRHDWKCLSKPVSSWCELHSQCFPKNPSLHSQTPHLSVPIPLHSGEYSSYIWPLRSHSQSHNISRFTVKVSLIPTWKTSPINIMPNYCTIRNINIKGKKYIYIQIHNT